MSGVSVFDMFVGFLRSRGASDAVVRMFANFSFTGQIVALGGIGETPLRDLRFCSGFPLFLPYSPFSPFSPLLFCGGYAII